MSLKEPIGVRPSYGPVRQSVCSACPLISSSSSSPISLSILTETTKIYSICGSERERDCLMLERCLAIVRCTSLSHNNALIFSTRSLLQSHNIMHYACTKMTWALKALRYDLNKVHINTHTLMIAAARLKMSLLMRWNDWDWDRCMCARKKPYRSDIDITLWSTMVNSIFLRGTQPPRRFDSITTEWETSNVYM